MASSENILTTYHVTMHDEEYFKDGIWPLTHFGPPAMGVYQTISKNLEYILNNEVTLNIIEVDISFNKSIETKDSGTSNMLGFLLEFFEAQNLNSSMELIKVKKIYRETFKVENIDNRMLRNRESRAFAANICIEKGYDLSSYVNIVESKAPQLFENITEIPKVEDSLCYINMSSKQIIKNEIIRKLDKKLISHIIDVMRKENFNFDKEYRQLSGVI